MVTLHTSLCFIESASILKAHKSMDKLCAASGGRRQAVWRCARKAARQLNRISVHRHLNMVF